MYTLSIYLYSLLVRLAAFLGNVKAKQLAEGQQKVWKEMNTKLQADAKHIWIHCASVGEFEQGRPLMEDIRAKYPQYKMVLTFFSSSGYELRKNYPGADYIFYLPYDTRHNAKRFVKQVRPEKIYFIKYEFWRNYLRYIQQQRIPLYLVSANFRTNQIFFKWYGGWYRELLKAFTYIFVQNERSKELLLQISINQVSVTGDTRFDRVCRIVDQVRPIPEVERFVDGKICLVAGSTWPPDEELLAQYINTENRDIKWIFAPHELHDHQIKRLINSVNAKAIRYSQLSGANPTDYQILIIDNIGMLSSLYQYGTVAYVGGGFGRGIHNTLEAAAYGIPVLFGPAYKKFQEAVDMIDQGASFSINNYQSLSQQLNNLLDHPDKLQQAGRVAGTFVASGRGATDMVIRETFK